VKKPKTKSKLMPVPSTKKDRDGKRWIKDALARAEARSKAAARKAEER
jgi:hypothetical protein